MLRNQPEKNQKKRCRCGSIKHLRVSSNYFPVGLAIIEANKLALGMGLSQSEAKKEAEDATGANVWRQRPLGRVKNQQLR